MIYRIIINFSFTVTVFLTNEDLLYLAMISITENGLISSKIGA